MTDSSNNNDNIKDIVPKLEDEDLPTAETQDDQLLRNLCLYPTVKEAAEAAGFTGSMLQSGVYTKIKRKGFQDKIREYAIAHNVATLPKIMFIEDKVIEYLLKKPLDASKHTRMLAEKNALPVFLERMLQNHDPQLSTSRSLKFCMLHFYRIVAKKRINKKLWNCLRLHIST